MSESKREFRVRFTKQGVSEYSYKLCKTLVDATIYFNKKFGRDNIDSIKDVTGFWYLGT